MPDISFSYGQIDIFDTAIQIQNRFVPALQTLNDGFGSRKIHLSCLVQVQRIPAAGKERKTELFFHLADHIRKSSLGDPETACCLGDIFRLSQAIKILDLQESRHSKTPINK